MQNLAWGYIFGRQPRRQDCKLSDQQLDGVYGRGLDARRPATASAINGKVSADVCQPLYSGPIVVDVLFTGRRRCFVVVVVVVFLFFRHNLYTLQQDNILAK